LRQELSSLLTAEFEFADYSVVLTRYENLQDKAIVLEGFVEQGELKKSFKGFVDLVDAQKSVAFVPNSFEPTPEELAELGEMNQRIVDLQGDPYAANEEPEQKTGSEE
jgi:hypothetical protein